MGKIVGIQDLKNIILLKSNKYDKKKVKISGKLESKNFKED